MEAVGVGPPLSRLLMFILPTSTPVSIKSCVVQARPGATLPSLWLTPISSTLGSVVHMQWSVGAWLALKYKHRDGDKRTAKIKATVLKRCLNVMHVVGSVP